LLLLFSLQKLFQLALLGILFAKENHHEVFEKLSKLKNYQNIVKTRNCDHIFSILEEKHGFVIQKCIKCFRIFEDRVNEY